LNLTWKMRRREEFWRLSLCCLEACMAITSIRCPVLGAHVARLTDLEGAVTKVICAEYDEGTGTCRLKKTALEGGPLTQLLARLSEDTLAARGTFCELRVS
jgi:hypothetical protein